MLSVGFAIPLLHRPDELDHILGARLMPSIIPHRHYFSILVFAISLESGILVPLNREKAWEDHKCEIVSQPVQKLPVQAQDWMFLKPVCSVTPHGVSVFSI